MFQSIHTQPPSHTLLKKYICENGKVNEWVFKFSIGSQTNKGHLYKLVINFVLCEFQKRYVNNNNNSTPLRPILWGFPFESEQCCSAAAFVKRLNIKLQSWRMQILFLSEIRIAPTLMSRIKLHPTCCCYSFLCSKGENEALPPAKNLPSFFYLFLSFVS